MTCFRFDLRRLLPLYMDGAASPRIVARIERHLLDCSALRAELVRLRATRSLLGEIPATNAPSFERLMSRGKASAPRFHWIVPPVLRHIAADALIVSLLFVTFALFYTHSASARSRLFDTSSFRSIDVRQVAATDDPHVIVSGVVSEISGDTKEGSHRFRLSDPQSKAFVVCEILDGDTLKPPAPGSRVRVWGVSRYDSSPNHRWFEIHPVLKVEVDR